MPKRTKKLEALAALAVVSAIVLVVAYLAYTHFSKKGPGGAKNLLARVLKRDCAFRAQTAPGLQIIGLQHAPKGDKSASACAAACCAQKEECDTYNYCPGGMDCGHGPSCWTGKFGSKGSIKNGWVGATNSAEYTG